MNYITQIKNIFLETIAMCAIVFVFGMSVAYAQTPAPLDVVFETNPLFSELGVLPGDGVAKTVTVANNSDEDQDVIIEAINAVDSDGLGNELIFVISKNSIELYNGTLGGFMRAGEVPLSSLSSGGTATYSLAVSFEDGADNFTQKGTLGFDLCVGFFGGDNNCGDTEIGGEGGTDDVGDGGNSGGGGTVSGTGGGGTVNITRLQIENERVTDVSVDSGAAEGTATVEWDTNLLATSQVIYGPATDGVDGSEIFYSLNLTVTPYFGYPYATDEDSVKMAQHTLVINGLVPNQVYKYRVVSRASPPTVSYEHTFIASTDVLEVNTSVSSEDEGEEENIFVQETTSASDNTGVVVPIISDVSADSDIAAIFNEEEIIEIEAENNKDLADEKINNMTAAAFFAFPGFSAQCGLYLFLILLAIFIAQQIWNRYIKKDAIAGEHIPGRGLLFWMVGVAIAVACVYLIGYMCTFWPLLPLLAFLITAYAVRMYYSKKV